MKKISLLLAFVLVFSMCVPLYAGAEQTQEGLSRSEVVALGCEAFPEYADNIASPRAPIVQTRSAEDPVVVSETRSISDGETITYQEYASGRAFLTFYKSWNETSSSSSSTRKDVKGSLYVTCNLSLQEFVITDLQYRINYNGYDTITNKGDRKGLTTCPVVLVTGEKQSEDASGPAYLQYEAIFYPEDYSAMTPVTGRIAIKLGSDQFSITVSG